MAHDTIRCNLVSATFPFYTEAWGQTVIIPRADFNYDRQVASAVSDYDKDKGIPQLYYAHNVMPTNQGVQAIGYNCVWGPCGNGLATDFDKAFPINTPDLNRFIFVPAAGKNYIADATVGDWVSVSPLSPGAVPENVQVTTAFVQGQTYICYANYGVFIYNETTKTLPQQVLIGLVATNVVSICAANGYLIAITESEVAWSSLTNPLDFTPDLATGAGGGSVNEAQGALVFCVPISGGFMLYCETNVVSATYTGNVQYPFTFRQVNGSAGVPGPGVTSWQANLPEHYSWSSNGLQRLGRSDSALVFPELSDFLTAKVFEDFDEATLTLNSEYLLEPLNVQLVIVSARYIVISYGKEPPDFTHALIYDMALKRWGKVKITHRDCFQWNFPNLYGEMTYDDLSELSYDDLGTTTYDQLNDRISGMQHVKEALAFLQADGTIEVVDFDVGNAAANGVMLAGKYQLVRNNFIIHQQSNIETIVTGQTFNYYLLPTLDGKTLLPAVTPFLSRISPRKRTYKRRHTCMNFSSLFMGAFNLVSFQIDVAQGPYR